MAEREPDWGYLPGVVVPLGWRSFFHRYRLLFSIPSARTWALKEFLVRGLLLDSSMVMWAMDSLIANGWQKVPMSGPIFIIGHQRSGTTLLHRLLASDVPHARALQLHEMVMPSVTWGLLLSVLRKLDTLTSGALSTRFTATQEALLKGMDPIHRIRLDEVEEDEFVLWAIFQSAMCVNGDPVSCGLRELDEMRNFHDWPVKRQVRALGYYRACLLKKVYRQPAAPGEPVWVVAKNPAFSQKIPELLKVFPDAKFIHLVRDPLETIPSRLSLVRAIWRHRFSPDIEMTPEQVSTIVDDSVRTYEYAFRDLSLLAPNARVTVKYDELTKDPRAAVERIYKTLELPEPGEVLQAALKNLGERQPSRHSEHRYTLEEFGLDADELRKRLGDAPFE